MQVQRMLQHMHYLCLACIDAHKHFLIYACMCIWPDCALHRQTLGTAQCMEG